MTGVILSLTLSDQSAGSQRKLDQGDAAGEEAALQLDGTADPGTGEFRDGVADWTLLRQSGRSRLGSLLSSLPSDPYRLATKHLFLQQ